MPPLTRIICLANSRKHGARCIAGLDTRTGAWVRPVSELEDGRLTKDRRLVEGREPELLEVLDLPVADSGPDYGFESENRALLAGAWQSAGKMLASDLVRFCSTAPVILHNEERYVTAEYLQSLPADQRRTLELVATAKFSVFHTGLSEHGGHKWHACLETSGGAKLTTRITDPVFVEQLECGHQPGEHCLVTVSLSMPYCPADWTGEGTPCWKLIAAVIELDAARRPTARTFSGPARPRTHRPAVAADSASLTAALDTVFGFSSFLPYQENIVRAILEGRDVFAVMPTGGGKSLCYQLPARLLPGTCVVVSPLIALMKDQVDAAAATGLSAACYNSTQGRAERLEVLRQLHAGKLDLLYVSPERLAMAEFLNTLRRAPIELFAVDEAHCISEWGHDFRPDYLFLSELIGQFPYAPLAAFTATATERVQTDVVTRLGLRNPYTLRASFDRPNLVYRVVRKQQPTWQILEFVREHPDQSGIVYRATRADVEKTAAALAAAGVRALPYHAGLDDQVRDRHQEAFRRDHIEVMVATIAFGMGIDKSNVRFVLHGDLPKNLESYYQETGRAGRDGEPADCLLLFSPGDLYKNRHFIVQIADEGERRIALRKLQQMANFATVYACRRKQLLAYFGEHYAAAKCDACDVCADEVERVDATAAARTVLEAVHCTGERYGVNLIVELIGGAATQRLRDWRLTECRSYGAGRDQPKSFWRRMLDELLAQQCLVRTDGEYPILNITGTGREVLNGQTRFFAAQPPQVRAKAPSLPIEAAAEANPELFEALRRLRRQLADARGVPAYVVFSDRTLREMATRCPDSCECLRTITGVGEVKLAQYGAEFASAIRDFLATHPCVQTDRGRGAVDTTGQCQRSVGRWTDHAPRGSAWPSPAPAGLSASATGASDPCSVTDANSAYRRFSGGPEQLDFPRLDVPETILETWGLVQQDLSSTEIARRRGMKEATIFDHLEAMLRAGYPVEIDRYVSADTRQRVERQLERLGTTRLAPIHDALQGTVSYDQIRLVRAHVRHRSGRTALHETQTLREVHRST